MRLALDTNAYVAFCRGETEAAGWLRSADEVCLPYVVVAELRAGFLCGMQGRQNERHLQVFLSSKRVNMLLPDEQTTHHYARLFAQLRQAGTPIPTNDIWIAALSLQHELCLLSHDHHFDKIPQLMRAR